MAVSATGDQDQQVAKQGADLSGELAAEQKNGQQWLESGVGIGMVDALAVGQIGVSVGGRSGQCLQVVADDLGGDILDHGLLGQSGDVLEIETVLDSFERLLNAPALVVEFAETACREKLLVEQVGHQDALCAVGRDVTDQTHTLRRAWALVVERVLLVRRGQHDDPFARIRTQELAHAGEAGVGVDAHAELDVTMVQHCHQPAAGIATIKQQIGGGEAVEMLDQELSFATFVDAVQGSGEHEVRTGQEQAEQDLIGNGGTVDVAGAQAKAQRRGVGGNQRRPRQRGTKWSCSARAISQSLSRGMALRDSLARAWEKACSDTARTSWACWRR